MPETETFVAEPRALPTTVSVRETRIDPAHEFNRAPDETPPLAVEQLSSETPMGADDVRSVAEPLDNPIDSDFALGEVGEQISPELIGQFRAQAQQLSAHLEARQRELDRREAELNAALAQHEAAGRNARLWFQERHHDLADREKDLQRRDQQITERLLELDRRTEMEDTSSQSKLERQQQQDDLTTARENELAVQDLELVRRQVEVDEMIAEAAVTQEKLIAREKIILAREGELQTAEAQVARTQVELDEARRLWEAERAEVETHLEQQRQQMNAERRRAEIEHQQQTQTLNARWGHLQRRGAALDQSRAEALRLQRETLEMRLATEELWAQMSSMAPPAAITQSLAALRVRLAEHHQMEQAELTAQRQQIEELAAKVAKQHEKVAAQRRSFEAWAFEQKQEIQSQSATIKTRDEELRQQRDQIQQQRRQWDAKRGELESEIRRLQAERHQVEAAAM